MICRRCGEIKCLLSACNCQHRVGRTESVGGPGNAFSGGADTIAEKEIIIFFYFHYFLNVSIDDCEDGLAQYPSGDLSYSSQPET